MKARQLLKGLVIKKVLEMQVNLISRLSVLAPVEACILAHGVELCTSTIVKPEDKEHSKNVLKALSMVTDSVCEDTVTIDQLTKDVIEVIDK